MIFILHYLQDPKLWELRYAPYNGECRICIINRRIPFRALITLHITYLLSPPTLQVGALNHILNPKPKKESS